jgi:hypothetical protein
MLLLTDASVLIHDAYGKDWYRLRPDSRGSYNTTAVDWSGPFSMQHAREDFASGVLSDGRVYVVGGEYLDGSATPNDSPLAEIFDPQTNLWTPLNKPTPAFDYIQGDAISCVLADKRVIFGALSTNQSAIWDPVADQWSEAGTGKNTVPPTKSSPSDEETWTLLPDGTVLTIPLVDPPSAEKYLPASDTWIPASQPLSPLALINLPDTTVKPPVSIDIREIGPAILLPDGRLFFIGGTGHTAFYHPPASPSAPGTWTAGPDLPRDQSGTHFNHPNGDIQTAIDAPAVLLPGGKVLLAGGQTVREVDNTTGAASFWSNPTTIFIFDPATGKISTRTGQPPHGAQNDCWTAKFLLLPNGQVLLTTQQSQAIDILADPAIIGTPQPAWKPVIRKSPPVMTQGQSYTLEGTQINGLSQACSYGDDAQMATNYPLAWFTGANGDVSYFRTFNFSTMGVATGAALHSTQVEIPLSAAPGNYKLQLIANGIASDAVAVQIVAAI